QLLISSRRRHTRSKRDWSSDVCSSDLHDQPVKKNVKNMPSVKLLAPQPRTRWKKNVDPGCGPITKPTTNKKDPACPPTTWLCQRSEERRVGRGSSSRG